ncbi:AbrB/MazE/SpoVT family DNA-binding domain-containing protein [Fulvimarina endophytica]|uniref:AbrB/MazE/SpoVT family DNA-binding domain-containing protein n=2 Tax=Fulvimarina endophytica TaxID=2293836 RepID=A0A371WXW2_9HYPH|nr:AbrB/MazE/SpoVT family DNA-binding domain-containing protein [Fulvimarina endophytica]
MFDRPALKDQRSRSCTYMANNQDQERAMKLYELPMQENGRVVLPSDLRKSLGLSKGDKVLIEAEGDEIKLTTARLRRKRAQAIAKKYARPGVSVVDEFLSEKRAEAEREIARIEPEADADKMGDRS